MNEGVQVSEGDIAALAPAPTTFCIQGFEAGGSG